MRNSQTTTLSLALTTSLNFVSLAMSIFWHAHFLEYTTFWFLLKISLEVCWLQVGNLVDCKLVEGGAEPLVKAFPSCRSHQQCCRRVQLAHGNGGMITSCLFSEFSLFILLIHNLYRFQEFSTFGLWLCWCVRERDGLLPLSLIVRLKLVLPPSREICDLWILSVSVSIGA